MVMPCRHRAFDRQVVRVALLSFAAMVGCEAETTSPNPANDTASDPSVRVADEPPTPDGAWETWDVVTLQNAPVGYQSLRVSRHEDVIEGTAVSKISIRRFGQESSQSMELTSHQRTDGQVIRVEANNGVGTRTTGRRVGQTMQFEVSTLQEIAAEAPPQRWEIPLPPACGGYFAVEISLRQSPMRPGEQRQLTALLPVINQPATISLRAIREEVPSGSHAGQASLRIEQEIQMASPNGTRLASTLWVDSQGAIMRSELPSLEQVSYQVPQEVALAAAQDVRYDLGESSTVHIAEPVTDPHRTAKMKYVVILANGDPSQVFPTTPWQSLVRISEHVAHLTVTARRPSLGERSSPPEPVEAADRASSTMIEVESPIIQEMARQIHVTAETSWERAKAVEAFVHQTIQQKDFSTAFATAAEVARTRQGDCTEHAVLTAALCRALGIPARVLIGMVYVPSQQGFGFHMWNEVYLAESGEWIPLDATIGTGGTGAAHVVLARSALTSSADYASLLPVLQVLGQLEMEIIHAEPQGPS